MNRIFLALLLGALAAKAAEYVLPAFPGAEGWGMAASGGRGGQVIYVTNTNDTGVGSFRAALTTTGPRTVIILTNGWVSLSSPIRLRNQHSNLTLVGHLAPGLGFGVRAAGDMNSGGMIYSSSDPITNIVIRFMRFRMGAGSATSADTMFLGLINGPGVTNGIIANSSFSWGHDEVLSVQYSDRFTVQDCIISEGLADSYAGSTAGNNYGGLYGGHLTVLRNLFAHNYSRSPHARGPVDVINNVAFNTHHAFHTDASAGFGPYEVNLMGNYYVIGPALTNNYPSRAAFEQQIYYPSGVSLHLAGNYAQDFPLTTDQTLLVLYGWGDKVNHSRFLGRAYATVVTADDAFAHVQNNAGAYLPARDAVDARLLAELNGQALLEATWDGWITSESEAGGYPALTGGAPYTDTDMDGMDDDWEMYYFGTLARDGTEDADGDGYTDLEEFLWGTNPMVYEDYYRDFYTGALRSDENPVLPPGAPPVTGTRATLQGKVNIGGQWQ
jgi:pectate lyase